MARAKSISDQSGKHYGWHVECPGCKYTHVFDARWSFDGNENSPTFAPSMLVNQHRMNGSIRCHSYVRGGRIEFLPDCDHELAGQTVELPELPE